jgi:acyl-coenzyme A synthetase/AMP-(fatty) acid ligase
MNSERSELGITSGDDTPVIVRGTAVYSRGELRDRSDALAERLRREGIGRVLVRSDDPLLLLAAIDASTRVAADLWVAHTSLPDAAVAEVVERHGVQLSLDDTGGEARTSAESSPGGGHVYMMTSGTTGRPKIAAHTLESIARRARTVADLPQNRGGRWLLTYQPTGFAGIQVQLTAALSKGLIVVPEQRSPRGFYEAASQHSVERISATPTFFRSFLMVARPGTPRLRQITLGGEAADQVTLDRLRAAYPEARITHMYASTEAGVVFAVHDGREGFPSAWLDQTVRGVELRVRDGLLQIRTPGLMQGYLGDTPQPLLEGGWLQTADVCEITEDRVKVLGRQDSTINVAGAKVYPQAVERFLLGLPGVLEARVFGVPSPISGQLVAAEVVLERGLDEAQTRAEVLAACRKHLAGYQVPRSLKLVDAVEVRASSKKG